MTTCPMCGIPSRSVSGRGRDPDSLRSVAWPCGCDLTEDQADHLRATIRRAKETNP